MTAVATPKFEAANERKKSRRGFFLALPAYVYLSLFFALPLLSVVVYSFAKRTSTGGVALEEWNIDSYTKLGEPIVRDILLRSFTLAIITTVICLVLAPSRTSWRPVRRAHATSCWCSS